MKLESLVGLGINDISNKLGRVTYTPSTRVTAVEVAEYQKKSDLLNRLCKEISFEQGDHTGIYTNEPPPSELMSEDWRTDRPKKAGWYEASRSLMNGYFRYFDGKVWLAQAIRRYDLKIQSTLVITACIEAIQKERLLPRPDSPWRNTPLPAELLAAIEGANQ